MENTRANLALFDPHPIVKGALTAPDRRRSDGPFRQAPAIVVNLQGPAERSRVSIDDVLRHLPDSPTQTSRSRDWRGVTLDVHAASFQSVANAAPRDHHVIFYCVAGVGQFVQRRAGKTHEGRIAAGMSMLMPAGHDSSWEGQVPACARLRVPPELVDRAAEETTIRGRTPELLNSFGTQDSAIELYGRVLLSELAKPAHPAQALITESVSCALAAHLLRGYSGSGDDLAAKLPSLSERTIADIAAYVESNFEESIGLANLADIAGVSRFHFTRLFKRATGQTPMAYVEGLRIAHAQDLIRQGALPLAHVALMAGFADQSHFTRRFHRHTGQTPAVYARAQGVTQPPRLNVRSSC